MAISENQLTEILESAVENREIKKSIITGIEVENILKIGLMFKACCSSKNFQPLDEEASLEENIKEDMKKVLNKYWEAQKLKNMTDIKWSVNIVVGNDHVSKSLRPIVNLKIPNGKNGEEVEFDLDSFSQFRYQVARAVLATTEAEEK